MAKAKAPAIEVAPGVLSDTYCTNCGQFCKLYKRKITGEMAQALIFLVQAEPDEEGWVNLPEETAARGAPPRNGDPPKLRYWHLVEPRPGERADGSMRNGWWRVTDLGVLFANNGIRLPKYALVYNKVCYGHEGERLNIRDALGTAFNYAELMGWTDEDDDG